MRTCITTLRQTTNTAKMKMLVRDFDMWAPQEDTAPTDEGRHDRHGCYPVCGPRPEGVEKEHKADP